MVRAETSTPERSVGPVALTFVAVGGMVGSGILFAPLFAAQAAGPAAIVAWPIGGLMLITVALVYAEVAAMLPVVGGLGRLPAFSHGRAVGITIGWVAWVGYVTAAPIETQVLLEYASTEDAFDWLFVAEISSNGQSELSLAGLVVATGVLALFTVLNAFGVALFARVNTGLTWMKLAFPTVFAIALLSQASTDPIDHDGFAPYGMKGVMAAITTGGVIFAFLGFRNVLDLAGEARRPQRTVPLALIGGIGICIALFTLVQAGFVTATSVDDLSRGWSGLDSAGANGPLAVLLAGLGFALLADLVLVDAIVGPFGAGLVGAASTGRLAVAVSENGLFPRFFSVFSARRVPLRALVLNLVVGLALLVSFRDGWAELLVFNSGAIVLSMCLGPVSVVALRAQVPDRHRPFRVHGLPVLARVAFVVVSLIVYWTGWETMWKLSIPIAIGAGMLVWRVVQDRELAAQLDIPSAIWLAPYYVGLVALTYAGGFGGGREWLPSGVDLLVVAGFALTVFEWAIRSGLSPGDAEAAVATVPLPEAVEEAPTEAERGKDQ